MSNHNYDQQDNQPLPLPEFTLPPSSKQREHSPERLTDDDGGSQVSIIRKDDSKTDIAPYTATPTAELSFTSFVER